MIDDSAPRRSALSISVVVLAHRRLQFLADALDSALDSDADEILLVAPEEPAILCDPRYRGVRFVGSPYTGVAGKIADASAEAQGDLVSFLEDDDLYAPGRLERVRAVFAREENLGWLQNGYCPFETLGQPYRGNYPHRRALQRWQHRGAVWIRGERSSSSLRALAGIPAGFNTSSMTVRRPLLASWAPLLTRCGMLADTALLYAALASPYDLLLTPEPWTFLRVHPQSHSDPMESMDPEAMARRRKFLEELRPGREAIREFLQLHGSAPLRRALEGQCASEEVIHSLRSPTSTRRSLAALCAAAMRRYETFEVQNRRGAVALGLLAVVSPSWGHSIYRTARRLG